MASSPRATLHARLGLGLRLENVPISRATDPVLYSILSQLSPSFQPTSTSPSLIPLLGRASSKSSHLVFHLCPQELGPSQPTFTSRHQRPVGCNWPSFSSPFPGAKWTKAQRKKKRDLSSGSDWPGTSYLAFTVTYGIHCNI